MPQQFYGNNMGFDGALNMAQFGMPNMGMPPPMEQMYGMNSQGMNNQGSVSEATIKKEVKDAIKKQLKRENKKRKKEEKEEEKQKEKENKPKDKIQKPNNVDLSI